MSLWQEFIDEADKAERALTDAMQNLLEPKVKLLNPEPRPSINQAEVGQLSQVEAEELPPADAARQILRDYNLDRSR